MVEELLVVVLGVPVIVWLAVRAWHKARAVRARIAEVREELARNPQEVFLAQAELMREADRLTPKVSPKVRARRGDRDTHG